MDDTRKKLRKEIIDKISQFGDGLLEFETKDIEALIIWIDELLHPTNIDGVKEIQWRGDNYDEVNSFFGSDKLITDVNNSIVLRTLVSVGDWIIKDSKGNYKTKLSQQREEIGKENEKLLTLLQMRDGGGHDADCKANYGRQCNCGHETAKQYLRRNK